LLGPIIETDEILIACLLNNGAQVEPPIVALDEDVLLQGICDSRRGRSIAT